MEFALSETDPFQTNSLDLISCSIWLTIPVALTIVKCLNISHQIHIGHYIYHIHHFDHVCFWFWWLIFQQLTIVNATGTCTVMNKPEVEETSQSTYSKVSITSTVLLNILVRIFPENLYWICWTFSIFVSQNLRVLF